MNVDDALKTARNTALDAPKTTACYVLAKEVERLRGDREIRDACEPHFQRLYGLLGVMNDPKLLAVACDEIKRLRGEIEWFLRLVSANPNGEVDFENLRSVLESYADLDDRGRDALAMLHTIREAAEAKGK